MSAPPTPGKPHAVVRPDDVVRLVQATRLLGGVSEWRRPAGYPDSLALCVLDSIWSLGANYDRHVIPVLNRYRELTANGARGHTSSDLVRVVDAAGGPTSFAEVLHNRQRTSTRGGVLKAQAVYEAACMLAEEGIETPERLRADPGRVAVRWRTLPGQRSSATGWRYLLLLAGASEAKPDRMIVRFVSNALNRQVLPDEAHSLLTAVAGNLDVALPTLDHRIWLHQSGRLGREVAAATDAGGRPN